MNSPPSPRVQTTLRSTKESPLVSANGSLSSLTLTSMEQSPGMTGLAPLSLRLNSTKFVACTVLCLSLNFQIKTPSKPGLPGMILQTMTVSTGKNTTLELPTSVSSLASTTTKPSVKPKHSLLATLKISITCGSMRLETAQSPTTNSSTL